MRVIVEIREDAFKTPKTAQQIEQDVREGATLLWLVRGDVKPGDAGSVTAPAPADNGVTAPQEPTLHDLLILGPDVGDDADFERRRHPRRELPEWDT
jgi:hypothetical protein